MAARRQRTTRACGRARRRWTRAWRCRSSCWRARWPGRCWRTRSTWPPSAPACRPPWRSCCSPSPRPPTRYDMRASEMATGMVPAHIRCGSGRSKFKFKFKFKGLKLGSVGATEVSTRLRDWHGCKVYACLTDHSDKASISSVMDISELLILTNKKAGVSWWIWQSCLKIPS